MMTRRLGIIGLGQISGDHMKGVRELNACSNQPRIEVSAVVETFPGRAQQWVAQHFHDVPQQQHPAILTNWRDLLQGPHRPDIVSILLPHHLHLEVAQAFLHAGIGVQMQKPIALTIDDGRRMIETADRTSTALVISEPAVLGRRERLILDWLRSGRGIGTPTFMIDQAVIDLQGGYFMTPWRHLKGCAGAGWFIDHGVHRTHWMLEAFGPCRSAFAATRQIESSRCNERWGRLSVDTEDLAAAILQFESGAVVQWSVMSGGRGKGHHHVQVWGTNGSYQGGKVTLSGQPDSARDPEVDESAVPRSVPVDYFADSYLELLTRMEDPTAPVVGDPRRALHAQAIVYACLESSHTGTPVDIADILSGKRREYEQTVCEARERVKTLDMNSLT